MQWYYTVQGQRQGPVDDAGLEALVRQGVVRDDTYVWREGLAEWQTYGAVKPKPATAPAPAPQARPVESSPAPAPLGTGSYGAPQGPQPGSFQPRSPQPAGSPQPSPWEQPAPARRYSPPPAAAAPAGTRSPGAFFFYPVLDALGDGRFIRKCVIVGLKVAAVVVALGGLLVALSIIATASHGSGASLLGGILFALLILAAAACVAQIYWYRSGSVAALGHSRYTVIPIFSILSRAAGEAAATGFAGVGVGACLFLWLSPEGSFSTLEGLPFLAQVPAQGGFVAGILVLVYLAALGVSALILGYLWAECIMLLVDIEQNTRKSA